MDDRASRYQFGQTNWKVVLDAGGSKGDTAADARNELLVHYHDAVYRYLAARTGDVHAAGELFSQFAERVLEIHPFLQRADPEKGRFRDYLRAVLSRMIIDWHRRRAKEMRATPEGVEAVQPESEDNDDKEFQKVWSEELLNHAWKGLELVERNEGKPYHSLLLFKAHNPKVRSDEMAREFSTRLGKPLTADNVRKLVQRGHELLNDLLIVEVARSLRTEAEPRVAVDKIEEELINLHLLDKPRRDALDRYREGKGRA